MAQNGTKGSDYIEAAAVTADGNIVLAGGTTSVGSAEAASVKLHSNSTVLWRWQVKTYSIKPARVLSSADTQRYKCMFTCVFDQGERRCGEFFTVLRILP